MFGAGLYGIGDGGENGAERMSGIGCIGIGRMGYAMAARLAKQGADLTVWNRTRAKAEPLASQWDSFLDCVETRQPPKLSGSSARRSLETAGEARSRPGSASGRNEI